MKHLGQRSGMVVKMTRHGGWTGRGRMDRRTSWAGPVWLVSIIELWLIQWLPAIWLHHSWLIPQRLLSPMKVNTYNPPAHSKLKDPFTRLFSTHLLNICHVSRIMQFVPIQMFRERLKIWSKNTLPPNVHLKSFTNLIYKQKILPFIIFGVDYVF